MKRITFVLALLSFGVFLSVGTAAAISFTPISPGPETPLIGDGLAGNGSILDQIYGLGNLQRVDDDGDKVWFPATFTATARAKFAGFNQDFGYIPDSNGNGMFEEPIVPLFNATGNGINLGAPSATFTSGNDFLWAVDPSGAPLWTSSPGQNSDGLDHMVTWLITGGASAGNHVIAWEDLFGGGDRDFNDLVVEVRSTSSIHAPEPTTMLLFGVGLIGLAGFRRKFKK